MIKNILFDMGNVLIRFEPKRYVKNAGLSESDQQLLLRELYGSIDWVRLDRGTLTEAEVIDRCVSRVGEHLRGAVEKLVGHWDRPELPVEGMKALTDELYEKGYGLYLLTNAGPRQREYWPRFRAGEHFPEERVYRSADVHLLKPDPAFFEGALEKFGLDRAECVFIDDSAANAEGAQRVGLDAIVFFGDAARLRRELRERGVDVSFSFDEHDFLAEAAIANVGVIDGRGRLLMPRFTHALPGTTALLAMEIAGTMMEVIITDITEEILYAASEILIFGTGPECVAVTRYEGKPVGNGRPGPSGRRLRSALHEALLAGGTPLLKS